MTFLTFSASFFMYVLNLGLLIGAVMAVLLLLRPVTVRLLTPGQRVALWGVAWVLGALPTVYGLCSRINLPFPTFPDLLVSRAEEIYPGFLPDIKEAGRCYLALPGDRAVTSTTAWGWPGRRRSSSASASAGPPALSSAQARAMRSPSSGS